jgi:hypothetical protein
MGIIINVCDKTTSERIVRSDSNVPKFVSFGITRESVFMRCSMAGDGRMTIAKGHSMLKVSIDPVTYSGPLRVSGRALMSPLSETRAS